jgi:hypothetical protein
VAVALLLLLLLVVVVVVRIIYQFSWCGKFWRLLILGAGNSVCIGIGLGPGRTKNRVSILIKGKRFISSSKCMYLLWEKYGLLFIEYLKLFSRVQISRIVKLTTYSHLMPRLRKDETIPTLSHMPSWFA